MYVLIRTSHFIRCRHSIFTHCHARLKYNLATVTHGEHKQSPPFQHNTDLHQTYVNGGAIYRSVVQCHDVAFWSPIHLRRFSTTAITYDKEPLKPSSKVEATVEEIKKKKEDVAQVPQVVVKKPMLQRVKDELVHYYHGFRLLFLDIKISTGLVLRVLNGKTLTRREYRLLMRTVGDMFRLVPFSVFIIVPFMEFLLPVFIKFFPGMLPSTFQTASEKEDRLKRNLKGKLEMAKFLQQTLDDMALQHKARDSQLAKEFADWFTKVRTSGSIVSTDEIMKYSKLFEDEITLDSLARSQLVALCRVLDVQTLGTNYMLRFQLRMKLRSLAADDKMIEKEGVNTLTLSELQQACRSRGMRAYGMSEERLRTQLTQWLDLSLNKKLPPSLLLLSRALMLPETIPTSDKLKATISMLPETLVAQTQAAIGEKEGIIDPKVKLEVIKQEQAKVKEERKEHLEEKARKERDVKETLKDKAPILTANDTPIMEDTAKVVRADEKPMADAVKQEGIEAKDLQAIEQALDNLSKDKKKFVVEKEVIEDLKEEMADYQEDVEDFKKVSGAQADIKESKAAQRLFKKVNQMISKMDSALVRLETKEKQLRRDIDDSENVDKEVASLKKEQLLRIDEVMEAIRQIQNVPDNSRIEHIKSVLGKIDDDHDGSIKVEDVLKIIEFIGKDSHVHLSSKQVDELVELLLKEEILDVENKIEKALQKEKTKLEEVATTGKVTQEAAATTSEQTPPITLDESAVAATKDTVDKLTQAEKDCLKKCAEAGQKVAKEKSTNVVVESNAPNNKTKAKIVAPPIGTIDSTKTNNKSKTI